MVGTIASPSSPSVRFTAFELPIITSAANTGKNRPSGISTSLNTGMASSLASGSRVSEVIQTPAIRPITACTSSLTRPGTPLWLCRDSFR